MKSILLSISATYLMFTLAAPVFSQDAATPGADLNDTIKENVKRRIQEVVKGQSDTQSIPLAYPGTLTSQANHTLSIRTRAGIKLASSSAQTTYVEVPGNTDAGPEDAAINAYIVALGFLDDSQVLNTKRVIIHEEPPNNPDTTSFYGQVTEFDQEEDLLTLVNHANNQTITLSLPSTTLLRSSRQDGSTQPALLESIVPDRSNVLAIYEPAEAETLPTTALLLIKNPQTDTNIEAPQATSSDDLPPELQP